MPKRVYLTIKGVSRTIAEWTLQPGAAHRNTIDWRLKFFKWDAERAVFTPSMKQGKLRPGVERPVRRKLTKARPAVVVAPCPRVPNPYPPCLGSFRSYPLEALELLRRCA